MTQAPQQANPPPPPPTQSECMAFVSFARYTSLAADRLAGALLNMTTKLEDEGILKVDRPTRLKRDKKLRAFGLNIQKTDTEIQDMMKLIPNHPESEQLIRSLFLGVKEFSIQQSTNQTQKETESANNNAEIPNQPPQAEGNNNVSPK